jgi:hypothetical protein
MCEEPNPSPSEFRKGYRAYQAHEARDAMYKVATFLVRHFWGEPRDMADGMGALLLTWNQGCYRFGSFDFACLEEALRKKENMRVIEKLRPRNIQSFVEADEAPVKELFSALFEALQIKGGVHDGYRSPVAAAKALHLLAPDFLPLWDNEIAKRYKCRCDWCPDQKYVKFIYKMRGLARRLQKYVPPRCGKTFLKLIDEYNYAKCTQGWI